ncbi:MAG: hypothetical protein ACRCX2_30045 [Paraclostridium sp.]
MKLKLEQVNKILKLDNNIKVIEIIEIIDIWYYCNEWYRYDCILEGTINHISGSMNKSIKFSNDIINLLLKENIINYNKTTFKKWFFFMLFFSVSNYVYCDTDN